MFITGVVIKGKGEARKLGYPTANLEYACERAPDAGVWTCRVRMSAGVGDDAETREAAGLAVIGMWQLESGLPSVEVHVLDFEGDLYGATLAVSIEKKLRDLRRFATVEALIEQIRADIAEARSG